MAEVEQDQDGGEDEGGPEGEVEEAHGQAAVVLVHDAADQSAQLMKK